MSELRYERESKKQIWVSLSVSRALWMLAKHYECSPDQLGDDFLHNAIANQYPQIFEHQKEIDALEKKLIESLKTSP